MRRWAPWAALILGACGSEPGAPHDAGLDAAPQPEPDAARLDAATPDAGPGVCGGDDRLEVVVRIRGVELVPAIGAHVDLYCGETVISQTAGADGRVVFEGLDLPAHPVDLTVSSFTALPSETFLGVDGSEPVEVTLDPGGFAGFYRMMRGRITFSEPDAVAFLWMPFFYQVSEASPYTLFPYAKETFRLTAIEYLLDGDDAVPLSFFDEVFPEPPFEEGPDVTFVPGGSFATASVDMLIDDERLAERWIAGVADPLEPRVSVTVLDRPPAATWSYDDASLVGFTTHLESTDDGDRAEVAWWPEQRGEAVTQLQMVDPTLRVWSVARRVATPDTIGSYQMPAPPRLTGVVPEQVAPLEGIELGIERPDWLGDHGRVILEISGNFGLGPELVWRIHPAPDLQTVRLPPPEPRTYASVMGFYFRGTPDQLVLSVFASNEADGVETFRLYGEDGRYLVSAE